jgi:CspA family cold shock protein
MTQQGVVKWFSRVKGYGFIQPDGGDVEVFVHYDAIEGDGYRNLYEGDRVEYIEGDKGKGPCVLSVKVLRAGWRV